MLRAVTPFSQETTLAGGDMNTQLGAETLLLKVRGHVGWRYDTAHLSDLQFILLLIG